LGCGVARESRPRRQDDCQQYKETASCRKMDYFHASHPPDRYLATVAAALLKKGDS
jgi:hypothetical protein